MIASEAQPFSKTGGLADVATALPKALGRLGHDVTLITPRYRGVADGPVVDRLSLEVAGASLHARNLIEAPRSAAGRRAVLLLDCPELYDRRGIYYDARGDYADNAVRYAFLSAAAIDWASQTRRSVRHRSRARLAGRARAGLCAPPRHLGAWTLRTRTVSRSTTSRIRASSRRRWVPRLGLPWDDFTMNGFEFFDRLSFMKAGINFADAITTVSPTYAEEIQRPEYGHGLDGVIRARRDALVGILNGIDHDEWNPLADPFLPAPFDAESLDGKAAAKRALLEAFGFTSPTTCWRGR